MYNFIATNWIKWPTCIKYVLSSIVYTYIDHFDLDNNLLDEIVDGVLTSIERENDDYIDDLTNSLIDVIKELDKLGEVEEIGDLNEEN